MLRWIAWPPAMTSSALVLLAEELSGAFGKHRRWRNAVDANVVATELAREAARQSDHRRLRYRVVQRKRHAVDRGKGGHVDDTDAPCLAHLRHHCLAALPYALDVRAHRIVPCGLADRLETRASSVGGTSRPSALAVLRLITSSYLVGACTGRSAGVLPLRMRST